MYRKITNKGKKFIEHVVSIQKSNTSLIKGNNGSFPYSINVPDNKIWTANIKKFGKDTLISNNSELGTELIEYYNHYAKEYDIDANVCLAQAYQESGFKTWIYVKNGSTASGLVQFLMGTIYDVVINNNYKNITPIFTQDEISRIIKDLDVIVPDINVYDINYYLPGKNNNPKQEDSIKIREQLHQNFIDNIDVAIKAQCKYLKYCLLNSDDIVATSLFAYNRGIGVLSDLKKLEGRSGNSFRDAVNAYKGDNIKEGLEYVNNIFGILGDPEQKYVLNKFPKRHISIKGYSFGYENELNLSEKYNSFND